MPEDAVESSETIDENLNRIQPDDRNKPQPFDLHKALDAWRGRDWKRRAQNPKRK